MCQYYTLDPMNEDTASLGLSAMLGSLPPHVEGKVNGYLSMTVDSFRWRCNLNGKVHIRVSWWGEKQKILLLPQVTDGSDKSHVSFKNTCVYRVMTNTELFLSYLQDCEVLNFEVYEQGVDCLMGTATLKHLMSVVLNNPWTESCVVSDKNGTEIADLRISFVFHQNELTYGTSDIKNKSERERTFERVLGCEIDETLNSARRNSKYTDGKSCDSDPRPKSLTESRMESMEKVAGNNNTIENADVVSNSTISELLERCYNIRQEYHSNGRRCMQYSKNNVGRSLESSELKIRGKSIIRDEELAAFETVKFHSPMQEFIQLAESSHQNFERNVKCGNSLHVKIPQDQLNVSFQKVLFQSESGDFNVFEKQRKDSRNEEKKKGTGKHSNELNNIRFLQLSIQTLSLNYVGLQRVLVLSRALSSSTHVRNITYEQQLPSGIVYFVEYEIPQYLRVHSNNLQKIKRPWNCNVYRLCSRQKSGTCIHFHRQMIHMLASQKPRFMELLCSSTITFKLYSRHVSQRLPCLLGKASLSLGNVIKKCAFNALLELTIHPESNSNPSCMLSLGILKLKVEFGANRTCFKQKPVSSIDCQSLQSSSESEYDCRNTDSCTMKILSKGSANKQSRPNEKMIYNAHAKCTKYTSKENITKYSHEVGCKTSRKCSGEKEILLFGLLHVSSGLGFKSSSSYLISHGFWKEDVMTSEVCLQTSNPNFKFHKIMPVLLSLELIDRCYNNFMVVEVWSLSGLVGIAKLPLNQFYIAFRDPPVVEQLLMTKYPIISVDGWVHVVDPVSQHQVGKLKVVLALGTENQIQMLEMTRCMKEGILNPQTVSQPVTAELDPITSRSTTPINSSAEKEPALKVTSGECFQNGRNCNYSADKRLQVIKGIISRESLLACGDYSNEYLQKLIHEESDQNEHFVERKSSSLQSSQNSHFFRARSFHTAFSGSSVNDCSGGVDFPETSLVEEIVPAVVSAHSNFDPFDVSKGNPSIRTNLSSTRGPKCVSQSGIKTVPKLNSDIKVKNGLQLSFVETDQNSKSVANVFGEDVSSHLNEEIDTTKRKCGSVSTDNTVDALSTDELSISNNIFDSTPHHNVEEDSSFIGKSKSVLEETSINENDSKYKYVENSPNDSKNEYVEDRLCNGLNKTLTVEDLNNISKDNIDFGNREPSDLPNYQLCKSSDSAIIAALTENASTQTDVLNDQNFFSVVEITNALYVPKLDSGKLPSCYVTFHTANNSVISTPFISENTDPVWNWSSEVWLPAILLGNNGRCLILKVWHKKDYDSEHPNALEDLVIGFVALDLQVLVCGLPCISGWFNICDISGSCKGQIQISVTPLENVSLIVNKTHYNVKEKENRDFTEATMTHFLPSPLDEFAESLHQGPAFAEKNSILSSISHDVKDFLILSSESSKEICQSPCIDRNEYSQACYKSSSKKDSVSSKFSEILSVCANQRQFKNPEKVNNSQEQINSVSSNPEKLSPIVSNQNCSEYLRSISYERSSSLMETLRQKFQELDNIMHQMQSKTDPLSKTKPEIICSENKMNKLPDHEYCNGNILCCRAQSMNISEGAESDNDFLAHNCKIFSAVKEGVSNNEHLNGNTSWTLPMQESESVFYNSSSIVIPTGCKNATINESKSQGEREKNSVTNVSEKVLVTDLMTDYLMNEALHDLDLENIFNPLLFQHILANHQCQRCCPHWLSETNGSSFPCDTDPSSQLPSKRNKRHFWKSQKLMKIISRIPDETCIDEGELVFSDMNQDRRSTDDTKNEVLPCQAIEDRNQIHSRNEREAFLANSESSAPFVLENISFSKCINKENVGKTSHSNETKYLLKSNLKEVDCPSSIQFLNITKPSSHSSKKIDYAPINSHMNSHHKICGVASSSDDVKDVEECRNCNSKLKNKNSMKHPVVSTISSKKSYTLDSSEGIELGDDINKSSDEERQFGKVDLKKDQVQEKV
ncbi:hypothetical protein R5R35_000649 [Gryllus longicercus]|uniref:C2 domain-containing protein n=1 Tax=Gryllus longicercus TaxID=2509291 RepID=A0AAN9VRD9_9ORTH